MDNCQPFLNFINKNPAYGKFSISRRVWIKADLQKEQIWLGVGPMGGGGQLLVFSVLLPIQWKVFKKGPFGANYGSKKVVGGLKNIGVVRLISAISASLDRSTYAKRLKMVEALFKLQHYYKS